MARRLNSKDLNCTTWKSRQVKLNVTLKIWFLSTEKIQ